jgi:membrane associated rhomboid family serine protease
MAKARQHSFVGAIETSAIMVGTLILIKLVEWSFHLSFSGLGIAPRTKYGAFGIIFSPLLHANSAHLLANSIPLFVLLILLFWDRHYHPYWTLAMIWVGSGLGTWLIGRDAVHIGASSVIFGLVTYLIVAGVLMKSWRSALVAVLVLILFGGILYGVLPQAGPISWEGHLSGAIVGVLAAKQNHQ